LSEDELLITTFIIFQKMGVLSDLPIQPEKLQAFILAVRLQYYRNPYHNFYHAVDVLQASMYIMKSINIEKFLRPHDILGLLVSAYCHDIGHPGCNNFFLTNQGSVLSKIYNDRSVLENYHLMLLYSILDVEETNIFSNFTSSERRELKGFITENILATDMAYHQEWIERLTCRSNAIPGHLCSKDQNFSIDKPRDRTLLGCCIIKCADLSNVARPYEIHHLWVDGLMKEYIEQGKVECDMGLPVHPFGNADTLDPADLQIYFSQNLASPFFTQFCHLFPNELDFILNHTRKNREIWQAIHKSKQDTG
jgi:hypothetical protein